ncbi:MAG: DUF4162 domain-containing protein, partial [Acidobacteriota bacterium]|nr:DUF4162 domain-containing protein [Acidobacteriota bacterium]
FNEEKTTVLLRADGFRNEIAAGLGQWVSGIQKDNGHFRLTLTSMTYAPRLLRFLIEQGVEVFEFTPQRLTLEDRFLQILGQDQGL